MRLTNKQRAQLKRRLQVESLESRIVLASDWTNPINVFDVDFSNSAITATPIDALLVINELNNPSISEPETGRLPELSESDASPTVFLDVSGDGNVSPVDAILVINTLNIESNTGDFSFAGDSVIAGSSAAAGADVSEDTLVEPGNDATHGFFDAAVGANGDKVVVWQGLDSTSDDWNIFAQRFDETGAAVGDVIQVNTTAAGFQTAPAVDISENGNFVVTWQSATETIDSEHDVLAQEFNSQAERIGAETVVNSTTAGRQWNPDVAYAGDDYTIVWQGRGEGDRSGVFARTFSEGVGGDEIRVNESVTGFQGNPAIASNANGIVVVAWQGAGNNDNFGVYMRDIGADGQQISIVSDVQNMQRIPALSVGEDGDVVVVWSSTDGVDGRILSDSGNDVFPIATAASLAPMRPDVEFLPDGQFAVAWHASDVNEPFGVMGQTFDQQGVASSNRTLINQTSLATNVAPTVAADESGYLVAWQGFGDADRHATFARFVDTQLFNFFALNEHTADHSLIGNAQASNLIGDVIYEFASDHQPGALSLAIDDHFSGNTDAPVVLIEYIDLQCPTCAQFHQVIEQIKEEFPQELLVVTRHMPLSNIHPHATEAALFAEAAGQQGMFDDMVDILFDRQADWSALTDPTEMFEGYATELGLNLDDVRSSIADDAVVNRVTRDFLAATEELNLTGVPAFFINGESVLNSQVPDEPSFSSRIQQALDATRSAISLDRLTGELRVADSSQLDFESEPTIIRDVIARSTTDTEVISFTINLEDQIGESAIPVLPDGAVPTNTGSGLRVYDFELGDGAQPVATDSVRVGYVGYLPDGTIFDSNANTTFPLSNLIAGFSEAVQGMQVGGSLRMFIPPELGYGSGGLPAAGIGGDDIIVFDVVLHAIVE